MIDYQWRKQVQDGFLESVARDFAIVEILVEHGLTTHEKFTKILAKQRATADQLLAERIENEAKEKGET